MLRLISTADSPCSCLRCQNLEITSHFLSRIPTFPFMTLHVILCVKVLSPIDYKLLVTRVFVISFLIYPCYLAQCLAHSKNSTNICQMNKSLAISSCSLHPCLVSLRSIAMEMLPETKVSWDLLNYRDRDSQATL